MIDQPTIKSLSGAGKASTHYSPRSINLGADTLDRIDQVIAKKIYFSRSELIRAAVQEKLERLEAKMGAGTPNKDFTTSPRKSSIKASEKFDIARFKPIGTDDDEDTQGAGIDPLYDVDPYTGEADEE